MARTIAPRTMTARYAGTCRTCRGPVTPGQLIVFAGRGRTSHATCSGAATVVDLVTPRWAGSPVSGRWVFDVKGHGTVDDEALAYQLAEDILAAGAGVSVLRDATGRVLQTRNARGTCEDAPCCGCCTF